MLVFQNSELEDSIAAIREEFLIAGYNYSYALLLCLALYCSAYVHIQIFTKQNFGRSSSR